MKHFSLIFYLFLSAAFFISCEDESYTPEFPWAGIVTGRVNIDGKPAAGAIVSLDNNAKWIDTTLSNGGFQLSGVPEFEHYLSMEKSLDSGRFIYMYKMIQMDLDGVDLRTVNFDAPASLHVADTVINNAANLILTWNKAGDEFLYYIVYRQSYPNIKWDSDSQKTGEINSISDTMLVIPKPANAYYYKVITFYEMPYRSDIKAVGSSEVYK